jgi:formate dehydrogenase major subunit
MQVTVKITDDVKPGTAYVPYFIREMITEFLLEHKSDIARGEDALFQSG